MEFSINNEIKGVDKSRTDKNGVLQIKIGNKIKTSQRRIAEKKKFLKKFWVIPIVILLIFISASLYEGYKLLKAAGKIGITLDPKTIFPFAQQLPTLAKTDDRTNLLIVGIDTRPNDPGLMNTDTIMIISYNQVTNEILYISIPRDMAVNYEQNNHKYTIKINGIYNLAAKEGGPEAGIKALEEKVREITGIEIHYAIMINYYAFVQIIDALGGIDVCVERSFTSIYPKPGKEPGSSVGNDEIIVHFDKGCQHMNGERALIYARARRSSGVEGSDYARALRQQKVVSAVYEKFKKSNIFNKFEDINQFLEILSENIRMFNISTSDLKAAWEIREKINLENQTNLVLSPAIGHWKLLDTNLTNYQIFPVSGNWEGVKNFVHFVLENPQVYKENASIAVYDAGGGYKSALRIVDQINNGWLIGTYNGKVKAACNGIIISSLREKDIPSASLEYLQNILEGSVIDRPPIQTNTNTPIAVFACPSSPAEQSSGQGEN